MNTEHHKYTIAVTHVNVVFAIKHKFKCIIKCEKADQKEPKFSFWECWGGTEEARQFSENVLENLQEKLCDFDIKHTKMHNWTISIITGSVTVNSGTQHRKGIFIHGTSSSHRHCWRTESDFFWSAMWLRMYSICLSSLFRLILRL